METLMWQFFSDNNIKFRWFEPHELQMSFVSKRIIQPFAYCEFMADDCFRFTVCFGVNAKLRFVWIL